MGSILVEKLSVCLIKFDRVYKVPTMRVFPSSEAGDPQLPL